MTKILLLTLTLSLSLLLTNCYKQKVTSISIISNSDTVKINELFNANIYVSFDDSVIPELTMFYERDTFLIPFDQAKGCGVFKAIARYPGNNTYKGTVNYINKEGYRNKEYFTISFFVIP
jgi:hypothetical protein